MGSLQTTKKPAGLAQDPAQAAKAAALKPTQSTKENTNVGPAQVPPVPPEIKGLVRGLSKNDLRIVLNKILETNMDSRATLVALCGTPVGSSARPYDFGPLWSQCVEAISEVGGAEWREAGSHRDMWEERGEVMNAATKPVQMAIDEIRELCRETTTSKDTKIQGMKTLLDIADLVEDTSELDGSDWDFPNMQSELVSSACAAIETAFQTFDVEEKERLSQYQPFQDLLVRMEGYEELESLLEEIKSGEDEEESDMLEAGQLDQDEVDLEDL